MHERYCRQVGHAVVEVADKVVSCLILPVLEGHSVKRVYSLTEVFDDNENKIKQDQATAFTAVQDRITGPCRKGWCSDSSQAMRASSKPALFLAKQGSSFTRAQRRGRTTSHRKRTPQAPAGRAGRGVCHRKKGRCVPGVS